MRDLPTVIGMLTLAGIVVGAFGVIFYALYLESLKLC